MPAPAKLICGLLLARGVEAAGVEAELEVAFGPIEERSECFDFDRFTSYYEEEMGPGLSRKFVSFCGLKNQESLAEFKRRAYAVEELFRHKDREPIRPVNLDPGLVFPGKLILASAKDGPQRVPLGSGFFGEVTLFFKKDGISALPWTYPDYASGVYNGFLLKVRRRCIEETQAWKAGEADAPGTRES